MQKIIINHISVKTGTGDKGPWTITTLTDEKGARYSSFDTALSHLTKGTVLEIEPEVKGQFINIKEYKILQEGTVPPGIAPTTPSNGDERQASIETQTAVKLIFEAYLKVAELAVKGGTIEPRLVNLFSRVLDWCDARIPVGKPLAIKSYAKPESPPESQPDTSEGHFNNAGEFWKAATKRWDKAQSDLVVILELNSAKDVKDFDWAWLELEKKCGK